MEFRVRCRDCNTVFCADCKRVPYHKGHTCAGFVEFQKARHCRFCGTQLTQMNTAKDAPGPGLRDCCTEEECLDKRDVCCSRIKGCGCPCNGVRDEKEEVPQVACLSLETSSNVRLLVCRTACRVSNTTSRAWVMNSAPSATWKRYRMHHASSSEMGASMCSTTSVSSTASRQDGQVHASPSSSCPAPCATRTLQATRLWWKQSSRCWR